MTDGATEPRPSVQFQLVLATITVAALAAVATSTSVLLGSGLRASWWHIALGAAAMGLGRVPALSIRSGHHTGDYDLSEAAVVIALVLLPAPELVLTTAVVVPMVHALLRKPPVKVLFNGASVTVGVALAALVVHGLGGQVGALDGVEELLTIPAGLAVCLWTTLSVTAVIAAATGQPLRRTLRGAIGHSTAIAVGNVALGCAAVALARWSPQTLIVLPPVLAGLVMVYRLHVTSAKQRDSWRQLNAAARELADLDGDFVAARAQEFAMGIFQPDSVDVMIGTVGPSGSGAAGTVPAPKSVPVPRPEPRRDRDRARGRAPHRVLWALGVLGVSRVRRVVEVSQPLSGAGREVGMLRLRFTEPAPWNDHEQDVLNAFASLLALAIENARTFTEARHAAGHDELTGLGNRRLLFSSGEQALREAGEMGGKAALVLVDLDRFKEINDTLGHESGDRLLRKVAGRLHRSVRSDDLVTRLGGDEFAVLLTGLRDTAAAESVVAALVKALARPIAVDDVSVAVEASIGLACFPDDAETVHELLRRADVAMYQAKRARSGYRRYHPAADSSTLDHLALVADLHVALADGDVGLRFLPRIELASGSVTALRAVPTWEHPQLGRLPIERFGPAVERSGLAGTFTRHVLQSALAAAARWRADGHDVRVYVDLFARTMHEPELAADLARLLVRHGTPAAALTLVVPQPAAGGDEPADRPLSALRALGVELCLAGPQLPAPNVVRHVREIEVAAAVVRGIGADSATDPGGTVGIADPGGTVGIADPGGAVGIGGTAATADVGVDGTATAMAGATVRLAHELGMRVAARGVARAEALATLRLLGVDLADGPAVADGDAIDTDGVTALLRRATSAPLPMPTTASLRGGVVSLASRGSVDRRRPPTDRRRP